MSYQIDSPYSEISSVSVFLFYVVHARKRRQQIRFYLPKMRIYAFSKIQKPPQERLTLYAKKSGSKCEILLPMIPSACAKYQIA